jgi:hypothetical protein
MTDRDATGSSRREFVKRVSLGAAFAAPIVTSFSMNSMSVASAGSAGDASNASNSTTN